MGVPFICLFMEPSNVKYVLRQKFNSLMRSSELAKLGFYGSSFCSSSLITDTASPWGIEVNNDITSKDTITSSSSTIIVFNLFRKSSEDFTIVEVPSTRCWNHPLSHFANPKVGVPLNETIGHNGTPVL